MADAYVDTDVLIRLLTGDDPAKQDAAASLFERGERVERGERTLGAPDTVIGDAVYVLRSARLYHAARPDIAAMLTALVRLPHFQLTNRDAVLTALALYGRTALDFGDCMLIASMQREQNTTLYSYDQDFDNIPGVRRLEP